MMRETNKKVMKKENEMKGLVITLDDAYEMMSRIKKAVGKNHFLMLTEEIINEK